MFRPRSATLILSSALALAACGDASGGDAGNAASSTVSGEPARARVHAFVNARLLDGTGGPAFEDAVVIVREGRIEAVGRAGEVPVPAAAAVEDLGGRFLVPGFINAHGHVGRSGDRPDVGEQLEIYAHYGVTTVLSLGDEAEDPREERWSPELRRARLFVSGPSLTPASPEDAVSEVERAAEMGADWIKIHVNAQRNRDTHPAVIAASTERGLPVAVHVEELEDARAVMESGASLIAHSVRDLPIDDDLVRRMLAAEVCLVPTFTRELSTFVYSERPDFFDDPFFLERSAPPDLESFLTPERRAQAEGPGARYWREQLPLAEANLRSLHQAGVGIAMGTDTGPTGRFQGYFEHLEMEMMVEAGMSPGAVLVSSTGEAARCIGLAGVVGTVEPGAWADLVALERDPRQDILATREIYGVWIAGNRVRPE